MSIEKENFQAESSRTGKEFELAVLQDLCDTEGYLIDEISTDVTIPNIGVKTDCTIIKPGDVVLHVEAKGGKPGSGKRPGAERTDNVKKAIANGALINFADPAAEYIIYFSAPPKPGSSSEEMIDTAIAAGFVTEVRYLEIYNTESNESQEY